MKQAGIFSGFTPEEEEYYAMEAEKMYDPETVKESNGKWKAYGAARQREILEEGKALYRGIAAVMSRGAGSPEVQELVGRWRAHMSHFWTPAVDQLVPLAEGYSADPRFKVNFDAMRPGLAEFMGEAVRIYVGRL